MELEIQISQLGTMHFLLRECIDLMYVGCQKVNSITASRKYGNSNCDDFVTFILTGSLTNLDKLILTPSLDFLPILSASPSLYINSEVPPF